MIERKVAVITGANSSLGLPIARTLLDHGLVVWGHYFSNALPLDKITHENFRKIRADLTSAAGAAEMFATIRAAHPEIHLLVNMVGPFEQRPLAEVLPEAWSRQIELNLNSVFHAVYFARPSFVSNQSRIINFTYAGVENIRAQPTATAYAAAKAGVMVLTKSLAAELGPRGIRVNAVAPGWMEAAEGDEDRIEEELPQIPLGRFGKAGEVAAVVKWLALDAPEYVSGANIAVGGGWEF